MHSENIRNKIYTRREVMIAALVGTVECEFMRVSCAPFIKEIICLFLTVFIKPPISDLTMQNAH